MSAVLTAKEEQLQNEQMLGNSAQHAYDDFIREFCEAKREALFDSFRQLPLTAELEMMEVKRMLAAVDTLEGDILTVINTGKMASITLDKEVKH
tara:strand:- start:107 stop:388 length:282 start_codon:yes stop_codon:yes gene_type:complete